MALKERELQVYPLLPSATNPTDNRHPVKLGYANSTFAPLASPALTGTPTAPNAAADTNTTQIATTAFVIAQAYAKLASPTFTGTPLAPSAAAGTNTTQIATTAFVKTAVDAAVAGIDWHEKVRLATAAALPASTYSNGAGTITADAVGILTVDGTATLLGDRLLIKDQVSAFQNGLYTVTTEGTAGVAFVLTRATDMDSAAEFEKMSFVPVRLGTANGGEIWYISATAADPVVVGTSNITFSQFSAGVTHTASLGVELVGADFRLDLLSTGGLSLTGNEVGILLPAGSGLTVDATGLYISAAGVTAAMLKGRYYTATHAAVAATGGSGYYELTVTHNTGYQYGVIQVIRAADGSVQDTAIEWTNTNSFILGFSETLAANEFIIMYMGLGA